MYKLISRLPFVLVIFFGITGSAVRAESGKRVALIIGNAAYNGDYRLKNPGHDAALIAQSLKRDGFSVIGGGALNDQNKAQFTAAIEAFGREARGAEIAFFYFAGHGLQVSGSNWLVPVDADISNIQRPDSRLVAANSVVQHMQDSGAQLKILVLDTCREAAPVNASGFAGSSAGLSGMSPYAGGARAYGESLTTMVAPDGMLIAYSTQPGGRALDGYGHNGPYAQTLSNVLNMPNLDLFSIFNKVAVAVRHETNGGQQPWFSSAPIEGDFILSEPNGGGPAGQPPQLALTTPAGVSPYSKVQMPIYVNQYPFSRDPDTSGRCNQEELHLTRANGHAVCISGLINQLPELQRSIFVRPSKPHECSGGYSFYTEDTGRAICIVDAIYVSDPSFSKTDPVPRAR